MKQRILFINPFSGLGGAEQSLLGLILSLEERGGYDLHLLLPNEGLLSRRLKGTSVTVHSLCPPSAFSRLSQRMTLAGIGQLVGALFRLPFYVVAVARLVKKISPTIIHTNGIKSHLISALLPLSLKHTALLWHCRRVVDNVLLRAILSVLSFRVSGAITNSAYLKSLVPVGNIPVHVVYNPIDSSRFRPVSCESLLQEFPILKERTIILCGGVLAHGKGVDLAIRALAPLLRKNPDLLFVIVGEAVYETVGNDGYGQFLRNLAKECLPQGSFLFTGFRQDMERWMSLASVCVHLPHSEAFGRVVAEALACETPVVAHKVGGIGEIIEDGKSGYLVAEGVSASLQEKMEMILRDDQQRQAMGKAGRQSVVMRFSQKSHCEKMEKIYREHFPG